MCHSSPVMQVGILDELRAKLNYFFCLPWILCALALYSEEEARRMAIRIVEMFDPDPRPPPVHDVLELMKQVGAQEWNVTLR